MVSGLSLPVMLDMAPNAFDDQYEGCVQEKEEKAPKLLQEDFSMNEELKHEWKKVTGLTGTTMLDMAPNAFDDQYKGCVQQMENKAPELLQEDFNMNVELKLEWRKAQIKWNEIKNGSYPKGFNDFHGTAVVAYTGDIHRNFNKVTREFKKNPANFHFRAFHYYLTRALQLLSNQSCRLVYRGADSKFGYKGKGSVRFGQFVSSSTDESKAFSPPFFCNSGTKFFIRTCLGVYIKNFSYYPQEEEVLIPGYEVYQNITTKTVKECFEIHLDSPIKKKSNYNCYYSKSSTQTDNISSSETQLSLAPGTSSILDTHQDSSWISCCPPCDIQS
ncbi:T-cell ecto-ADP-ribosyltransferase 1 [Apodemus speciosus]|uniref:NAD(P)(+)--arginine ADP-ribosyltransferase n=1 Tax=Apodemus speciosus TaxID=105296 RepID=A0ABQ0FVV4_APOSI